jgi:hypothetical protein
MIGLKPCFLPVFGGKIGLILGVFGGIFSLFLLKFSVLWGKFGAMSKFSHGFPLHREYLPAEREMRRGEMQILYIHHYL